MISGEPIPPGMEDEVANVLARIQATLDSIFIPLIGLEFVLELLPSDPTEEPRYMCALCDKRGDPRTFPNHLRSFNHHMAYLVIIHTLLYHCTLYIKHVHFFSKFNIFNLSEDILDLWPVH